MQQLGDAFVLAGFFVFAALSVLIGIGAPWWRSAFGTNYFLMPVALTAMFGLGTATVLFGVSYEGRPVVRAVVLGTIVALGAWRILIVVAQQLRKRDQT